MVDEDYFIRQACLDDADFISDVIIEAEKSMTENLGLANFFDMSEEEIKKCLINILNEEVDGCEFSLSSFYVACYQGVPVSAMGGWLEGHNEDCMPSALLKANLINYFFPKEKVLGTADKQEIVKSLQIPREEGTYQLEYSYTASEHRGHRLIGKLMVRHLQKAKELNPDCCKAQLHVFENNPAIIKSHERSGFKVVKRYVSEHPLVMKYFPYNVELLMEKNF